MINSKTFQAVIEWCKQHDGKFSITYDNGITQTLIHVAACDDELNDIGFSIDLSKDISIKQAIETIRLKKITRLETEIKRLKI